MNTLNRRPAEPSLEPALAYAQQMLEPCLREAQRLVLEGATPAQVDQGLCDLGLALGLLALHDLGGLDAGCAAGKTRRQAIDPSYCRIAAELNALGRLGQKSGRGFYLYQDGERREDYEVVALAELLADELQIRRRPITEQEIHDRCLFTLINQGFRLLDESLAQRSGDIDQLWLAGYFASGLRGPMYQAEQLGLDKVLHGIRHYRDALGEYGQLWFHPAVLLERLVASGQTRIDKI